jgi:HAD superfamily hydrolase (TIGR01662 family)
MSHPVGAGFSCTIVVPTLGRPTLPRLLRSLEQARGPAPAEVLLIDDREEAAGASDPLPTSTRYPVRVLRSGHRGPAAARNVGWRAAATEWVAFLDDDVVCTGDWLAHLAGDLGKLPDEVGGSQGRLTVPGPEGRRATDAERETQGLQHARWITADLAYRRAALAWVGGFDERFRRAYREDADLACRVAAAGYRLVRGARRVEHPPSASPPLASLSRQAGNEDDALLLAKYGWSWRARVGAPRGRRPRHLAVVAAGLLGASFAAGRQWRWAALAGAGWTLGTLELSAARIAPGPRTGREVLTMALTSVAIPPLAVAHWMRGLARAFAPRPLAVLFDRDGTLIEDVPYNGDPTLVRLRPGARAAVDRLRRRRIPIGVVSNQSGIGRALVLAEQVDAVNRRLESMLGPIAVWAVCPHAPEDDCSCRKPRPGLVLEAARRLGVPPRRVAVVGDIGADLEAASRAGARAVLVPTPATRTEEVAAASATAPDLPRAVAGLLGGTVR